MLFPALCRIIHQIRKINSFIFQSILPTIWSQFPAGTSVKLFTHWLQQISVNQLRKFDYGKMTNMKMYNSWEPPVYDLSKVHVPTALIWSENDWLVGREV